jgi:hypothetical protein
MFKRLKELFGREESSLLSAEEEFVRLWKRLVPVGGESETLQGELVRALGRLEDEYSRNGNMNWEPGGYHNEFVRFLQQHLADPSVFDPETVNRIKEAAELIRLTAEDISEEKEGEDVMIVTKHNPEQAFKFLMAKVVEWCEKHPTPIAKLPGQDFWIT